MIPFFTCEHLLASTDLNDAFPGWMACRLLLAGGFQSLPYFPFYLVLLVEALFRIFLDWVA
jgi:hypothetical protein